MKRFLAIGLTIVLLVTALPVCSLAAPQYGTVQGGWLRLRSAPSFSASTLSSYYTGTVVEILGSTDSWYKVKVPNGTVGYMYSSYISLGGGGGGGGGGGTGNATVRSANGYGVRMRSGPGKGYRVLAVYPVGTSVNVLSSGSTWSKIQVGSRVGYMMSEFLDQAGGGGGGGGGTGEYATVWSPNGGGVRLRTGPGRGYGVLGVYSVGTRVEIVSHGATWDQVRVGSRVGYMMNYYLRYYSKGVVTGVSLSPATANARPGDTVVLAPVVSGTNLSNPAYTLTITQNATLARLNGNSLIVNTDAPVGAQIVVTATSVDTNSNGVRMSASCIVNVTTQGSGLATGITLLPASTTVNQGATVALTTIVSGTNLSTPAYTLSVNNTAYAAISGDNLVVYGNAPIGTKLTVTATTVDKGMAGVPLVSSTVIEVKAGSSVVTYFNVSPASATATLSASGTTVDLTPTILGTNLANPAFTVSIPTAVSSHVSHTVDSTTGVIHVNIKNTIPENTTFNVTVKAVNNYANGTVPQASIPIQIVKSGYIKNFELYPQTSKINQNGSTEIRARVTYENGSYVDNLDPSLFSVSITGGDAYGTLSGKTLAAKAFTGTVDQTVTLRGVTSLTKPDGTSPSATCTVTIKALNVPDAPTLSTVKAGKGQATVNWNGPANDGGSAILGYRVYYSDTATIGSTYQTAGASDTSATIAGLSNGVSYTFWVKAVNAQGESAASNGMSATPNVSVPDAPTSLTVQSVGDGKVTLGWTAPYDGGAAITEYRVYYSNNGTIGTDYKTTTATSLEVTGLTNGTPYTFWVKAVNSKGQSEASNAQSATPTKAVVAPTVSLSVDVSTHGQATVTWKLDNDGGDMNITYLLEYAGPSTGSLSAPKNTETISSLPAGNYTFTISATNSAGTGTSTQIATVTTAVPVAPTVDLSVDVSASDVASVAWNLLSDGGDPSITYVLEYTGPASDTTTNPSNPSVLLLPPGDYTFTLKATNSAGTTTVSKNATVTTSITVTVPTVALSVDTSTHGQAIASWSVTNDGGDPNVTYDELSWTGPESGTRSNPTSPVAISPLTPGDYTFTLTARNWAGTATATKNATVTISAPVAPSAPTGLTVDTSTANQAVLSWSAGADGGSPITGYTVSYSGADSGSTSVTGTSATLLLIVTGNYSFSVVAHNAAGTSPAATANGTVN